MRYTNRRILYSTYLLTTTTTTVIIVRSCACMQTELNRRREQEIMKLKKDLELVLSERETTEAALRKRHQDAINELTQQLETINRNRNK